jgi:hypothetical protein
MATIIAVSAADISTCPHTTPPAWRRLAERQTQCHAIGIDGFGTQAKLTHPGGQHAFERGVDVG